MSSLKIMNEIKMVIPEKICFNSVCLIFQTIPYKCIQYPMQTEQRLNKGTFENPVPQSRQTPQKQQEKTEKKVNCLFRIIVGFLQAVVHLLKLYRYNDKWDNILLIVGVVFAIGTGFGLPLFAVVAGNTIDAFDKTPEALADEASKNKNYLLAIGFSMLATGAIAFSSWMYLGERISLKFRQQYLKSILKQQIHFFEGSDEQQIYGKFEEHMKNIKEAAGLKAGTIIYIAASFAIAGKIATQTGFFLSLIMIPTLPILGVSGFLYSIFVQLKYTKLMWFYEKAQEKVRESLAYLRTVKQLNGQQYEVRMFQRYLKLVKDKVIKYCILAGLGAGIFSLMQFLVYCLAFWLGSHCVQGTSNCSAFGNQKKYTPGDVILIFFAFFVRLDSMQQLFPALKKIYNGTSSYEKVYKIISRKPLVSCPFQKQLETELDFRTMKSNELINHVKMQAKKLKHKIYHDETQIDRLSENQMNEIFGEAKEINIEFQNVTVISRSDKTKKILDDVTFTIDQQLTVLNAQAQQKQAVIDLILRLYDPDKGKILINGVDIKSINLNYLRKKIGYLDEKTYIFETTIKENIVLGNKEINDSIIWSVLEDLQIAQTIKLLDDQLYSEVGFEGKKLNQKLKRKIILARILVKNPAIVLFKEFYSFMSDDHQYKFYHNLESLKHKKVIVYSGSNERIIKKANKVFVFSFAKLQAEGDFYTLSDYYQDQIAIKEEIEGEKKITDQLYKSNLKTSMSLKSSEAMGVNEMDENSETTDVSPQKMLLIQQESHMKKYKGEIHQRLFSYLKESELIYCFGVVICLVSGILYPIFTIFMSDILLDTFKFKENQNETSFIRDNIDNPILIILWIGIGSFFCSFFQVFIFSFIGERVGEKLRLQTLGKLLKLPLNWFEVSPLRSSFRLSQTIKIDPTVVQNLLTNFYSIIIKNSSSFVAGIVIAFIYEWRSALLGFIVLPMMMLSGYLSVIFYRDETNLGERFYINSASVVTEALLNIKGIHTESCQELILQKYRRTLEQPKEKAKMRVFLCSLLFGFSNLLICVSYTIMFYFGTMFYRDNSSVTTLHLLTAIFAVIWSGWTGGANFIRLPAKKSCERAASNLFFLLDEKDEEQIQVIQNSRFLREGIKGGIEFREVKIKFTDMGFYLDKVSFKIGQKSQIAIFSTTNIDLKPIIDLLYRFTEPEQGQIYIDNQNIRDYDIYYLRSNLAVIMEEPVIFKGTLRQNILYNKENVSEGELKSACTLTNVMPMIEGKQVLQQSERTSGSVDNDAVMDWDGFETHLEQSMKMISTSQKQRIAMARSVLGNPKILLINDQMYTIKYIYESLYREAIRNVIKNRTSIFMPHYEQNLQTANVIMVLERDKILQVGNYEELQQNRSLIKRIKKNYYHSSKHL